MRAIALAVLAVLVAAPVALAKGVEKVEVCGAAGCSDVARDVGSRLLFDNTTPGDPPSATAFVRVRFTVGDGSGDHRETFAVLVTADGRHLRSGAPGGRGQAWFRLRSDQRAEALRATRGVEPFPAARMPDSAPYVAPKARVVETFAPAAEDRTADTGGIGTGTIAAAGAALLLLAAGLARFRPRRAPRPSGAA